MENGAVHLQERLPGQARQLAQEAPVEAEEDAETLGDGEDELAMGHGLAQVLGDVGRHDQGTLLVASTILQRIACVVR
jgi:hypothetical protein